MILSSINFIVESVVSTGKEDAKRKSKIYTVAHNDIPGSEKIKGKDRLVVKI